jgi:hypothetical protein
MPQWRDTRQVNEQITVRSDDLLEYFIALQHMVVA